MRRRKPFILVRRPRVLLVHLSPNGIDLIDRQIGLAIDARFRFVYGKPLAYRNQLVEQHVFSKRIAIPRAKHVVMVVAQKLQALRHNFLHIDIGIGHKRIRAHPIHVVEVAKFMHDCRAVRHFSIGIHENASIVVRRHFHGIAVANLSFRRRYVIQAVIDKVVKRFPKRRRNTRHACPRVRHKRLFAFVESIEGAIDIVAHNVGHIALIHRHEFPRNLILRRLNFVHRVIAPIFRSEHELDVVLISQASRPGIVRIDELNIEAYELGVARIPRHKRTVLVRKIVTLRSQRSAFRRHRARIVQNARESLADMGPESLSVLRFKRIHECLCALLVIAVIRRLLCRIRARSSLVKAGARAIEVGKRTIARKIGEKTLELVVGVQKGRRIVAVHRRPELLKCRVICHLVEGITRTVG